MIAIVNKRTARSAKVAEAMKKGFESSRVRHRSFVTTVGKAFTISEIA